jgi:hypothetical protein
MKGGIGLMVINYAHKDGRTISCTDEEYTWALVNGWRRATHGEIQQYMKEAARYAIPSHSQG